MSDLKRRSRRLAKNGLEVDVVSLSPPRPEDPPAVLCIVGSPACRGDETIRRHVLSWMQAQAPVIFSYDSRANFNDWAPATISHINGFPLQEDHGVAPLSTFLLRLVSLDEDQRSIFLSYRRGHGEKAATQLRYAMLDVGWDVFLDKFAIPPGADFQKALFRDMDPRSVLLVLETPQTRKSTWVADEMAFAYTNGIGVLALIFPPMKGLQPRFPPANSFLVPEGGGAPSSNADPELPAEFVTKLLCDLQQENSLAYRVRVEDMRLSAEYALRRAGCEVQPLGETLMRATNGDTAHTVLATARRPTLTDVHAVSRAMVEADMRKSRGWVVHRLKDPDQQLVDLLNWAGEVRQVSVVPVMELASRLAA